MEKEEVETLTDKELEEQLRELLRLLSEEQEKSTYWKRTARYKTFLSEYKRRGLQ